MTSRLTPLGRLDMTDDDPGYWHGRARIGECDARVAVKTDGEDPGVFDRVGATCSALPARLPSLALEIATLFLPDHQDWTGPSAAQSVDELAARLRLDAVTFFEDGGVELWFKGDVFSEHSIVAELSADGTTRGIERA